MAPRDGAAFDHRHLDLVRRLPEGKILEKVGSYERGGVEIRTRRSWFGVYMLDLDRLTESFDWIDLGFVKREATPKSVMKLGIRLHVAGLSLSDTVSVLDAFGVDRHRTTVHNWVQKADQQPADGRSPNHVAVDETVIWINDEQFWLFAAVDPETNYLLHVRLFSTRTTVTARMFLDELRAKHQVDNATFLVDRGAWLHAALHRLDLRFRHVTHGNRNAVERVF